jgi:alpha-galactosidase
MKLDSTANLWPYARPGFWNDPDMLEVGNDGKEYVWGEMRIKGIKKMNLIEYRTHFSMWCMVAAPLIAGNDLRTMKPEITKILTNKEVIAVDQDPLGKQGRRVRDDGDLEVWVKELSGNRRVVALLNRSSVPADIGVNWQEIGMSGKLKVRDLWQHEDLGKFKGGFTGKNIASHEAMILLVE